MRKTILIIGGTLALAMLHTVFLEIQKQCSFLEKM